MIGNSDIYSIVGHDDLTQEEFDQNYSPKLTAAIELGVKFLVGDNSTIDRMAQEFLLGKTTKVVVYTCDDEPKINLGKWVSEIGFGSEKELRASIFYDSEKDVIWERPGHVPDEVKTIVSKRKQRYKLITGATKALEKKNEQT